MGKLVKRSELIALGTLAIIFFSSQHLPEFLSSMDATTTQETYTAAAYMAQDEAQNSYSPPVDVTPSPTAAVSMTTASSTSDSTTDETQVTTSDETVPADPADTAADPTATTEPDTSTDLSQ